LELDLGSAHGRLAQIYTADVSSSGGGHAQPMTRPTSPGMHRLHIWLQLALSLRTLRFCGTNPLEVLRFHLQATMTYAQATGLSPVSPVLGAGRAPRSGPVALEAKGGVGVSAS
jgi:hypothetical protein